MMCLHWKSQPKERGENTKYACGSFFFYLSPRFTWLSSKTFSMRLAVFGLEKLSCWKHQITGRSVSLEHDMVLRAQNQKGFHVILLGEQLSTWRLFGKEVLPHFFALPRLLDSLRLGRLDGDNLFCQSGVKITSFFLLFLQTFLALSNNRIEQNGGNIDMIRLKRQHCCTTTTIQDGLSLDPREISCPSSTMSSFFIQKISDWSWKRWLLSKTRFQFFQFSKKLKETFVCWCLVVY